MFTDDYMEIEGLPIFQKGQEIIEVVHHICELIPDENECLQFIKGFMLKDSNVLTTKVLAAHYVNTYDIKMESATLIRKAALDLAGCYSGLKSYGFEEYKYFKIVLRLIEEYRQLFLEWIADFDNVEYSIDPWGLFNPPGLGPQDGPLF